MLNSYMRKPKNPENYMKYSIVINRCVYKAIYIDDTRS